MRSIVVLCVVCDSDKQAGHSCCVEDGVPEMVKLVPEPDTPSPHVDRDAYTSGARCALEGCLNFGYFDPLTDTRERCCGRSHEKIIAT